MLVHMARSSVHAGDESMPWDLELPDDATVRDLAEHFVAARVLASIFGGKATWVIQADPDGDRSGDPLASSRARITSRC